SPSICSESSEISDSHRSTDVNTQQDKSVPKLVFIGGSNPSFRLRDTLKSVEILGEGTLGTTVLAEIMHDTKVVLKILNEVRATEDEFKVQMKVFGRFRHGNVAAPRAYYFSDKPNGKFIVYDYYKQGSLFDMLHGKEGYAANWESRLKSAFGAAMGIAHIHKVLGWELGHGNIKSSNIYLNSQQYGCVSDFGLPRVTVKSSYPGPSRHHAREYEFKPASQETDVYSFGYVLLELLTGKSPAEARGFEQDMGLDTWARSIKPEQWMSKLFDKSLKKQIRYEKDVLEMMEVEVPDVYHSVVKDSVTINWEEMRAILGSRFRSMGRRVPADYFAVRDLLGMREMLKVAMRCLAVLPRDRPKMCDVVLMLQSIIREAETGSKQ
ncbi:probably inactive receptor-like protein kinase at5g41680, partial [Phtheirospermum japonicum]